MRCTQLQLTRQHHPLHILAMHQPLWPRFCWILSSEWINGPGLEAQLICARWLDEFTVIVMVRSNPVLLVMHVLAEEDEKKIESWESGVLLQREYIYVCWCTMYACMCANFPRSHGISRMCWLIKQVRSASSFPSPLGNDKWWTISERPWARDMNEEELTKEKNHQCFQCHAMRCDRQSSEVETKKRSSQRWRWRPFLIR